jgi:hypothetical protein
MTRAFIASAAFAAVLGFAAFAAAELPEEWILFSGGDSVQMSGSVDHIEPARAAVGGRHALWYRHAGHAWVISEPKLLLRVQELLEPVEKLGKKQGALGKKQGALGKKQGALGKRQGELGRSGGSEAEIEALAREQEALGHEQERIGHEQEALGQEQEAASRRFSAQLAVLVDQAIAAHQAQPLP